jgi:hypothetical protein
MLGRRACSRIPEKALRKGGRPRAMTVEEETTLYARFCEFRQTGHSERNAARLPANDLQKAGHSKVSDTSILRRMQRHAQKARTIAVELQRLNDFLGSVQNLGR